MEQKTISYSDVEKFLIELRSEIEQQLAKTPLTNLGTITRLEKRSENVLNAVNTIQAEMQYYERGICCVCGVVGEGITKGKTYCGFHGTRLGYEP